LYFFFARKTLPAISSTLESRQSTIKNDLDQADILSASIQKTRDEYEAMIIKARTDAANAKAKVENDIRAKNDEESAAFNQKSMDMIQTIETNAQNEQNRIKSDLEKTTVDLVNQIVGKLTDLNLDTTVIEKAVRAELSSNTSSSTRKKAA
jgi:F-type H+-transporting ATPase subunit b